MHSHIIIIIMDSHIFQHLFVLQGCCSLFSHAVASISNRISRCHTVFSIWLQRTVEIKSISHIFMLLEYFATFTPAKCPSFVSKYCMHGASWSICVWDAVSNMAPSNSLWFTHAFDYQKLKRETSILCSYVHQLKTKTLSGGPHVVA